LGDKPTADSNAGAADLSQTFTNDGSHRCLVELPFQLRSVIKNGRRISATDLTSAKLLTRFELKTPAQYNSTH
jgi:hypothetical protein